jgi:hypothetical protein
MLTWNKPATGLLSLSKILEIVRGTNKLKTLLNQVLNLFGFFGNLTYELVFFFHLQ